MRLLIRPATVVDATACHDLDGRCFPPGVAYDLASFRRLCAAVAVRWVALAGRKLVGFVLAEADPKSHLGLIITIDVDPACRRRGVGTRLMDLAEVGLSALGVTTVYLHMYTPHRENMSMYQARGYETAGKLPAYYGPGCDALLMRKKLNSR